MIVSQILTAVTVLPFLAGSCAILGTSLRGRRHRRRALLFHSITNEERRCDVSHCDGSVFGAVLSRLAAEKWRTPTVGELGTAGSTPEPHDAVLTFDDGFRDFYTTALPLLEHNHCRATLFPVAGCLGGRSTWDVFAPRRHLSAAELRTIAGLGHEIGSHTMTHPDLTLLSARQRRTELLDSRKVLEDIIGTAVTTLSFPFGSWNTAVWETAQECGYRAATAYRGHANLPGAILPVVGVYAFDTADDIIRKLSHSPAPSNAMARAALMPHFAKGSPLWCFRDEYRLGRGAHRRAAPL